MVVARFCAEPGCHGVAVEGRFCPAHVKDNHELRRAQIRENPETYAWYSLACWRSPKRGLRAWKLMQDPLCENCGAKGIVKEATDVHHKNGRWRAGGIGAWSLFMDRSNLESLCHECHSEITAKEHLCPIGQ